MFIEKANEISRPEFSPSYLDESALGDCNPSMG